jgi:hypothetical protein
MSLRVLFLIGALVLFVLAVVATAATSGQVLDVSWASWVCGGFIAGVASLLVGDVRTP